MQTAPDILIFSYKGDLTLLFFIKSKSIRGHESSFLVLRTGFKGDKTI